MCRSEKKTFSCVFFDSREPVQNISYSSLHIRKLGALMLHAPDGMDVVINHRVTVHFKPAVESLIVDCGVEEQ